MTLLPILHLVLNTFIYGQAPSWLAAGKKLRDGRTIKESWGEEYQTSKDDDLYEHDPKFWQRPTRVWQYFVDDLGDGHIGWGLWFYLQTMAWKVGLLLKV